MINGRLPCGTPIMPARQPAQDSARQILTRLSDGAFHSGQDLAEHLGVTRTAVWKHVALLEELGLSIERVRGKGYRIEGGVDLLDKARITASLPADVAALLGSFEVHHSIDSTNAEILRTGVPSFGASVCLAETQTAGRGRRGRAWVSPFASSLYLSIGWRFTRGAEVLEGLSLAVGVALCEALHDAGVTGLTLKWPNDVLLDGRKLAGILVELKGDLSGPCDAVIGVGVNVALPAAQSELIDQPWADLASLGQGGFPRSDLAGALLNRLLQLLANYELTGFAKWQERWQSLDAYAGKAVLIDNGVQRVAGQARGVDGHGALLLETTSGMQAVRGGEVSLRLQDR